MKRLEDFMCICNDEAKAKSEACLERVLNTFENTNEGNLLTTVVMALQWALPEGFVGRISGIACDMWSAVSVIVERYNEDTRKYEEHAHIWVQCDLVEHGIARAYELAEESTKDAE